MNVSRFSKLSLAALTTCLLACGTPPNLAQSRDAAKAQTRLAAKPKPDVQADGANEAARYREKTSKEAIDALAQTKSALKALDEGRTDDALQALALATGKLELVVARDPSLAVAPADIAVTSSEVVASKEAIRSAIAKAEAAMDQGKVQEARRLLGLLASEVAVTVYSLPLATYPDAIRAIAPLIDRGKIEEAKIGLQTALNTLVVTEYVTPIPWNRAEALLAEAQTIAQQKNRTSEQEAQLVKQLADARSQLEMAELLGYGQKDDYTKLYAQLEELEENTTAGRQAKKGVFDGIRGSLSSLLKK